MAGNQTAPTRAKKDNHPLWVKQRYFVIPATLQRHLKNAPDEIQQILCSIVSRIVTATKKNPEHFANILSTEFKNSIGGDYHDYLDILHEWRIVDINNRYSNAEGKEFPKSYRLYPSANAAAKVIVSFNKKVIQPLRDESDLTNDVAKFVHQNLKRIAVRENLLPQANPIDEVEAINSAVKVYWGKLNVHYSPHAKRLFHTAITMPKIARRNLILKADASVPLFEYDVKSCMPVILLGLIKDPAERATLTALLEGDIYTTIANEQGITKSRDNIKDDFLIFLNGGIRNYVYTFFHQHLPTLAEWALRGKGAKKGMAWYGQNIEARIMAQEVPRHINQPGIPITKQNNLKTLICGGNPDEGVLYIPMHDGWLGVERDEQRIASVVRNEFHRHLGYWVGITKTKLENDEETVLVKGAPPDPSQVAAE